MFFIMLILPKSFFKEFSKKFSIICKNWFSIYNRLLLNIL